MKNLNQKLFCFLSIGALAACSGGSDSSLELDSALNQKQISGSVVKGPIDGATLTVRTINPFTGFVDEEQEPLATSITDANGVFTFNLGGLTSAALIETSGGQFIDESDTNLDGGERRSVTLSQDQGLAVFIPDGITTVSVTIVSDALSRRALEVAESSNVSLDNAFNAVRGQAIVAMGFDPLTTRAVDPLNPNEDGVANAAELQYALTIGGLAYAAHEVAIRAGLSQMTVDVIGSVISDFTDGRLDGREGDEQILINDQPMADVDLASAIKRFRSNNDSQYRGVTPVIPNEDMLAAEPTISNSSPTAEVIGLGNNKLTVGDSIELNSLLTLSDEETASENLKLVLVEPVFEGFVTKLDGETRLFPSDAPESAMIFHSQFYPETGEALLRLAVTDEDGGASVFELPLPINRPPVTALDSFSIPGNSPEQIFDVLANDFDPDGDSLFVTNVFNFVGGTGGVDTNPESNGGVRFTVAQGFSGLAGFDYEVTDGHTFVTQRVDIAVAEAANTPPTTQTDNAVTTEGEALVIDVLENDSDADGDPLTITSLTPASGGTVVINEGGTTVTYTPNTEFFGEDQFTYTVSDGREEGFADGLVNVVVTQANRPPTPQDDTATTDEDTVVPIDVLTNDTDPDGDQLTIVDISVPDNGTVAIDLDGETLLYTPNEGFSGTDTFTYTVSDNREGGTAFANVAVTVNPANTAPVALDDAASTNQAQTVSIPVLVNDSDIDGDLLTVSNVTQPQFGNVFIDEGGTSVSYSPNPEFSGEEQFTYIASDGQGGFSDPATVTVTVNAVNTPPNAQADSARTRPEDTIPIFVLDNDSDVDHDRLLVTSVVQPTNGMVQIEGFGGLISYTADITFEGTVTFDYTVSDGNPGGESTATVTVTVTSINADPNAQDDAAKMLPDQSIAIFVLENDFDIDDDFLVIDNVTTAQSGLATAEDGFVSYTPNTSFVGTDTFDYSVTDGEGGFATANVVVDVTTANGAPVAQPDDARTEPSLPKFIPVLANDSDPDGDLLSVTAVTTATNGTVEIDSGGEDIIYTPNANFLGEDAFSYTVGDGNGADSDTTVSVVVTTLNAQPKATIDFAETTPGQAVDIFVLANDADPDGGPLTIVDIIQPQNGTATIDSGGGFITYTPNAQSEEDDHLFYLVEDERGGQADTVVVIEVFSNNSAPVADNDFAETQQDQPVDVFVLVNDFDPDEDEIFISNVASPSSGTAILSQDGTFITYTPSEGFSGSDQFNYSIEDGRGGFDDAFVSIEVTAPVNNPPVTEDDFANTSESQPVQIFVLNNDFDPDGDTLFIFDVTQPDNGFVDIDPSGENVTYTPNSLFTGEDVFTYFVDDGRGGESTAIVTVTVDAGG